MPRIAYVNGRYTPHAETKRAIVRLKEGQAIELF